MANNIGETINVTSLGNPRPMLLGQFAWPVARQAPNRKGNLTDYEAVSDRQSLDISDDIEEIAAVIIETLSRDERQQFQDPLNISFQGGSDNPVLPETTLSWWHLSTQDNPRQQLQSEYERIIRTIPDPEEELERRICLIEADNGVGTSDIFGNDFSRGYLASYMHHDVPVPQARYHCGLNQLIQAYKELLGITEIEFRVHGTTYYPMEIMHSVLICSAGKTELDGRHPLLEVTGFSATGHYVAPTAENVVSIEMNEEEEYRIVWRPFCTRKVKYHSLQWDHVTFAFLLPEGMRFPLPVPHKRQDKRDPDDPYDTTFGDVIEVTR